MIILSISDIIIKSIEVLIISSVKFIFAAPLSFINGFSFLQTFLITATGGVIGVLFFYHLGGWFFNKLKQLNIRFQFKKPTELSTDKIKSSLSEKIIKRWGLLGLIVLTPVLFSIPLGSMIANKYYSKTRRVAFYLTLSVICWSFVFATFCNFFI